MEKIKGTVESDQVPKRKKSLLHKLNIWYNKFRIKHSPQENLVLGFLLYTIVGWLLLCIPLFHKQTVSVLDNLFIATSAISTTGLVTVSVFDAYNATSTFIFYTTLIFFATFLLTFSESVTFQNLLFEVASALGTVGLSAGVTGDLSAFGKIVIILLMFIGRVGVLTFGFALMARKKEANANSLEDDLAV